MNSFRYTPAQIDAQPVKHTRGEVFTRFTSNSICYYVTYVYTLYNRRIHWQQRNISLPISWRAHRALAAILTASPAAAFAAASAAALTLALCCCEARRVCASTKCTRELRSTWTPDYYLRCTERKILEYGGSALPRAGEIFYTPELKLIHLPD